MRTFRVGLVIVLVTIGAAYMIVGDRLPPRTPLKVARNLSGLDLPRRTTIVSFAEDWSSFTGDGHIDAKLHLDPESYAKIRREAEAMGYAPTIEDTVLQRFLNRTHLEGNLYQYTSTGSATTIVVLDDVDQTLRIRYIVE